MTIRLVFSPSNPMGSSWKCSPREFTSPIENRLNQWLAPGVESWLHLIVAGVVWYVVLRCYLLKRYFSKWPILWILIIPIFKYQINVTIDGTCLQKRARSFSPYLQVQNVIPSIMFDTAIELIDALRSTRISFDCLVIFLTRNVHLEFTSNYHRVKPVRISSDAEILSPRLFQNRRIGYDPRHPSRRIFWPSECRSLFEGSRAYGDRSPTTFGHTSRLY